MLVELMKSKIHLATVTGTDLHYEGSLTVDSDLLDKAGVLVHEKVQVVNQNNGHRIETYCIPGKRGSGVICLNGAAARNAQPGDKVIIITYACMEEAEGRRWKPRVVFVDDRNRIVQTAKKSGHAQTRHGS